MANQWFKFYGGEFLADPKIGSLSAQERSCWITLMCLASTSSTQGVIEYLTMEVLLQKSGITFDPFSPEEWNALLGILQKFENMKMLKKHDNGVIEIRNWSKRQENALSVTERVRKYRAKQKDSEEDVTDVTNGNETANDRIEENRIELTEQSSAVEYEIVPDLEVKTKTPSRAKDIESVFRLFNNPAWQTWKVRPLERKAAEVLYDTHGLEVLKKRLARIATEKKKGDPYFPEVNTPSQLLDKMPNVERYLSV